MNYDNKKHVIEYIEGSKIKKFEVPKKDYNLKFDKMSYNDVLMYIKLTKEEEEKQKKETNTVKYKPLKTVASKTKDYFAQDLKLMSQGERLKKIAEFLISGNIKELKEFLSSDVFNDDPIIKSIMTLLNNKGYTIDEVKNLIKQKNSIDLYTNEIENCIVKDGDQSYSFEDITFKNTLADLFDLTKQVNILQEYTTFVPIDNALNFNFITDTKTAFKQLYSIFFKGLKFSTSEGKKISVFMSENYVIPSVYTNNYNDYLLFNMENFQLNHSKIPYYFYCNENEKIYINIKILYYLLQFNPSFKNNNYKYVVEKLKNNVVENIILIAGSAFDLDNIINSLNETVDTKDYYEEYVNLISDTIKRFFNKEFTQVVHKKIDTYKHMDDSFSDSEDDSYEEYKKGKGVFSFRRDTKETLQSLLNRIIKLENRVETQNEEIKNLKTGIKSINQSLPNDKRKEVFGNYFSNSIHDYEINGSLNPDKVYPKITFSEFRKLYNEMDSK